MNKENNELKSTGAIPVVVFFYAVSFLLFVGYILFYHFSPFEGSFNNLVLNSITSIAALSVAVISTAIFFHYQPQDFPRKIWKSLMLGSWSWFIAEVIWQIYAFIYEEVPVPGIADLGWVLGFIFFTIALYQQYAIINPSRVDTIRVFAIGTWLVVMLIPAVILTVLDSFSIGSYIDFYYPFADLSVGIAGLALILVFNGGALMRPWIGLMVFGASDLLYAWAEKTGIYAWSANNSNILTIVIDSSYLAAYLILAIGFLGHWILITRGLRGNRT